jgi:ABC-type multidrug transport system fused ATPase/permease subunit
MTLASIFVFLIASRLTSYWISQSKVVGRRLVESNTKMSEFMLERLRFPRLVKLSGTKSLEKREFLKLTTHQKNNSVHGGVLSAKTSVSIEPFLIASSLFFLYFSSTVLMLQIEIIGLYLLIALRLMPIVKGLLIQWQTVQRLLGSIEAIEGRFHDMELALEVDTGTMHTEDITSVDIEFNNVSYCYPTKKNNTLEDISFEIFPNTIVAIVGPSGSGKSTLIDLIPRIRNPKSGSIKINNTNINQYSLNTLRGLISYLPQKPQIFSGTVAEHISYGNDQIAQADIVEAAKLAGADEFIAKLDNGYDTLLGEGSIILSGGQNQRLDLARALARKSKLLILDEPTSNLDINSQVKFNSAISRIKNKTNVTIVMVTHNLSNFFNVDRVIVLKDGKVDADGTHNELIAGDSWYAMSLKDKNNPWP